MHPTQYLILTAAGKPVFALNGDEHEVTECCAVVQALASCYSDSGTELQSFVTGNARFVLRDVFPLLLVAVDRRGRAAFQLLDNLNLLHAQILSTLSQSQLERAFQRTPSLDLRPKLAGTEAFLYTLARHLENNRPETWLGALECLRLSHSIRSRLDAILAESRTHSLLYGMLLAKEKLVSVLRPKQHSLHATDVFLLLSMLFGSTVFRDGEHWMPVCLPRFNSSGFLYAYISFLEANVAIILISPDRNAFFEMRQMSKVIMERISKETKIMASIKTSIDKGRVTPAQMAAPGIQHLIYKSRAHVQFVLSENRTKPLRFLRTNSDVDLKPEGDNGNNKPEMGNQYVKSSLSGDQSDVPEHNHTQEENDDVLLVYCQMQAMMVENELKLHYLVKNDKTFFAWRTPSFDYYCAAIGRLSENDLSTDVRNSISWIRRHEQKLFLNKGATF